MEVSNSAEDAANMTAGSNSTAISGIKALQAGFSVENIPRALEIRVIPAICLFGLLGNALNLIVLSRRRLQNSMRDLGRSMWTGLWALAVSDLLFCLSVLPQAFKGEMRRYTYPLGFWLLYDTYSIAVMNTWLRCSTWITVALAVCQYRAVCSPIQAQCTKQSMGKVMAAVFASSAAFNVPYYMRYYITRVPTDVVGNATDGNVINTTHGNVTYGDIGETDDQAMYMRCPFFVWIGTPELVYRYIYFVLGVVVPVVILTYCTAYIIVGLKRSQAMRRRHSNSILRDQNIVSITLCVIVICHILLVIPAELMTFSAYHFFTGNNFRQYDLALSLCNALQAINFSFNFLLYCITNAQFRKMIAQMMTCQRALSRKDKSTPL